MGDSTAGCGRLLPLLLAAFFLWFFRDPARQIPAGAGLIVSPGDGLVTETARIETPEGPRQRISIFLSVFDVHVNRSPIAGVLTRVRYQKGQYLNAMNPASAERNEQNIVTVAGLSGYEVTFKQIAGLLARRIVFNLREGRQRGARAARGTDQVRLARGRRSAGEAALRVKVGERVKGGASVLAAMPQRSDARMNSGSAPGANGQDRQAGNQAQARLRRGMYLLPSLFTAGNIGAGYFCDYADHRGASADNAQMHLDWAAIAILFAIPFDALDGRIARMTNTCSDFGKELDSLADVITFGVAPSLLAFVWGFHFLPDSINPQLRQHLVQAGVFVCFLYLIGGASRLARFNISHDPQPRNPGRPDRKYFVGMPIPAAAGCWRRRCIFSTGFRCRRGGLRFPGCCWWGCADF